MEAAFLSRTAISFHADASASHIANDATVSGEAIPETGREPRNASRAMVRETSGHGIQPLVSTVGGHGWVYLGLGLCLV